MKLLVLFCLLLFISSCTWVNVRSYTLYKDYSHNTSLKIDGFYYADDVYSGKSHVYVLYNNGIILDGYYTSSDMNEMKNKMHRNYDQIWCWGSYKIENNEIQIQSYTLGGDGFFVAPRVIVNTYGKVINDTTFLISRHIEGFRVYEHNDYYHFQKYEIKPDSTQNWQLTHKRLNKYVERKKRR